MTNSADRSRAPRGPGEGLLHPVALAGIALLLLNDHVLKTCWPVVSGKLSDFAGLAFFPLLLEAIWERGAALAGRYRGPSERALLACIAATGIGFAAVETMPWADAAWRGLFSALRGGTVGHVMDWEDLVALPALWLPWLSRTAAPMQGRAASGRCR